MANKIAFTKQIKQCIDGCGKTRYAIGVEAEIDHATISRFMTGKGGLSMDALDRISTVIGMKAVLGGSTKKGK